MRGVNPQVDGDRRYAFVGPCDPIRLALNLLAHLVEVGELFPLAVEEFSPFCGEGKKRKEKEKTEKHAPKISNGSTEWNKMPTEEGIKSSTI